MRIRVELFSASRPDLPGPIALSVLLCFPILHGNSVSGDRLDGLAQSLLYCHVGGGGLEVEVHIRGLHGDDETTPARALDLDGMERSAGGRWPVAVVPHVRGDEDEREDQRDHDVIVKTAARIGPVEITFENFAHGVLTL